MTDVQPIRATLFDSEYARSHSVLSPPYDVLNREDVERLYAEDPHNIVRVEFGLTHDGDISGVDDQYTRAAGYLQAWLAKRVLQTAARPAFFLTEHRFPDMHGTGTSCRRGIFVGLPSGRGDGVWDPDGIRPHEHTFAGPKADRLKLLQATCSQTSPIFGFWNSAPDVDAMLLAVASGDPEFETVTEGEIGPETHRMWQIDGPEATARVVEGLRSATLYIADGHHRYETTAGFIRDQRGGQGVVLTYLCAAADPGLKVLPTHRIIRGLTPESSGLESVRHAVGDRWHVEKLATPDQILHDLTRVDGLRIGMITRDGQAVLSRPLQPDLPPAEMLPVWSLHHEVLPALQSDLPPTEMQPVSALRDDVASVVQSDQLDIGFTRSEREAVEAVRQGASLAFLLPPPSPEDIVAVADANAVMPQKSTYFYPKVPSGLVLLKL